MLPCKDNRNQFREKANGLKRLAGRRFRVTKVRQVFECVYACVDCRYFDATIDSLVFSIVSYTC
jgi:hypothetical protein